MSQDEKKIVVVGAGAAGFFGAIAFKEANPDSHVMLLEKARQVLAKVRISGGGRCNVTHSCYDISQLVKNYPRGEKALRSAFTRFQPQDTVDWFLKRGVTLKTESDGRMFPITDSSETIINCLMKTAQTAGVDLRVESGIQHIEKLSNGFNVFLQNEECLTCDKLLIATGSSTKVYEIIKSLGHTIIPLVPSLFTFNIPHSPLKELSGVAVQKVNLKIENTSLEQTGPLLITHFGFSGPAVLKLSAWGARILAMREYKAALHINWLPDISHEDLKNMILSYKHNNPLKLITSESPLNLPKNLWKQLISPFLSDKENPPKWVEVSQKQLNKIVEKLKKDIYQIQGKTTFKEEFVTCGGVSLQEVDFKNMESRICKNLYFAGEVLDIDGVTGGFNFQNAWTTSWIAGNS
jgi:predicted Rossmann fold flavoprotein